MCSRRSPDVPDPLQGLRESIRTPADRVRWACRLEATAPKAGNVYPGVAFEDLVFEDFVAAAEALAPVLGAADEHSRCGDLILQAVAATQQACGTNVNLGIILLLGPLVLAEARRQPLGDQPLGAAIADVLASLSPADSADVYAAIRLARPGGLGESPQMDLRDTAPESLIAAMRLAEDRDRIAKQYACDFRDLLSDSLVGRIRFAIDATGDLNRGIQLAQIHILSDQVDSLILRKCGIEIAREARDRAAMVRNAADFSAAWADYDAWLRADGHRRNPGTTADLIAAGLWVLLGPLKGI